MTHADLVVLAMASNPRPAMWRSDVEAPLSYYKQNHAISLLMRDGLVALAPYPRRGPNHPEGLYRADYICLTDAGRARAASLTQSDA